MNSSGLVTATPAIVLAEPAEEPFSSMVTQLGGAKGRQLQPALQPATGMEGDMNVQATSLRRDQVGTRESNSSSGKEEDT